MMRGGRRLGRSAVTWGFLLALMLPVASWAQGGGDYVIGAEDVLQISVWMHPELERTVTVDARGNVIFPPLGEIKASGSTAKQLSDRLGERLSTYLRQTATVTVTVTQFMSRSLLVSGAVAKPGRYGFERIPSLLDVLEQAGGALPTADLARVQITRRERGAVRTIHANVAQAMQEGSESALPTLQIGDVITVPATTAGATLTADAAAVLGEVNRPGLYPVGTGQDLWIVLAQAGGPATRGNLGTIKVVTREGDASSAVTVNLKETLTQGNRRPYLVKPGDVVYVNPRGGAWDAFVQVLGVTRDVVGLVALTQALQKN
jgi:polysaccharide export outer membrane protein